MDPKSNLVWEAIYEAAVAQMAAQQDVLRRVELPKAA
jgi:hypothetical protein